VPITRQPAVEGELDAQRPAQRLHGGLARYVRMRSERVRLLGRRV
jgi:hypothetical protein